MLKSVDIIQEEPYFKVKVKVVTEKENVDRHTKALMRTTRDLFQKCVQLDRSLPEEAHLYAVNIQEPGWLSDMIASAISLSLDDRQKLLLSLDPIKRLKTINGLLAQELDVLELEDEIQIKSSKRS